jgi:hypothetical protein
LNYQNCLRYKERAFLLIGEMPLMYYRPKVWRSSVEYLIKTIITIPVKIAKKPRKIFGNRNKFKNPNENKRTIINK